MSGLSYEDQTKVRLAVKEYLDANGMTNLRAVAKYVRKSTGLNPSLTTVARLVRDFGYDRPPGEWFKKAGVR